MPVFICPLLSDSDTTSAPNVGINFIDTPCCLPSRKAKIQVTFSASCSPRPGSLDICQAAIREFVAYVKANEPDTHLYVSLHESEDETRFLHYFVFKDPAAP